MSVFRVVAGALLIAWLLLPLVPLAIWSVSRGWYFPKVLPAQLTWQAWSTALSPDVFRSLGLTAGIALAAASISILAGVPAGRALGLHKFGGRRIVQALLLAPIVAPGIAVVLGIHAVFISLGLTNKVAGVILVHLVPTLPYTVLVMSGIFANFDPAIEGQARTLGATPAQTFRYVTLPAILPGIVISGLFAFLVSWSQYILTLTIGGGRVLTLPLLLFNFATSGRNDIAGALGIIYMLPGIIVLSLTARRLTGQGSFVAGLPRG